MSEVKPWVKYEKLEGFGGRFIVSPLRRGMGVTIGNSMRRALLLALSGTAITAVKIDGVNHEFSTLPSVVEDVLDIIWNLKGVVFHSASSEPQVLSLNFSGKGVVKASDIKLNSDVTIVNPEHHIAELTEKGTLKIQILLERGVGYRESSSSSSDRLGVDAISVDSSFSPIIRVNHDVENVRVGEELDNDSLILDVWTNGSITPEEAVQRASAFLTERINLFNFLNEKPAKPESVSSAASASVSSDPTLNLTIDDLELSARSSNCLKRAGIETVAQLKAKSMAELNQIKNFGKKSADEINEKLKQYGYSIGEYDAAS